MGVRSCFINDALAPHAIPPRAWAAAAAAPAELAAGDTDGRCRALEAGRSPAIWAAAAWEPAQLAMGRCGARDVVCRGALDVGRCCGAREIDE